MVKNKLNVLLAAGTALIAVLGLFSSQVFGAPTAMSGTTGLSYYWNTSTNKWTGGEDFAAGGPTVMSGTNVLLYCWNSSTNKWTACGDPAISSGSGTISTSSPLTAGLLVQSTAWNTIANIDPLGNSMIIATDNSGNLMASSSPSAAYYIATSTTATSTFAGGLNVDGTSLVVDYSSGKVGIGSNPLSVASLFVSGNVMVGQNTGSTAALSIKQVGAEDLFHVKTSGGGDTLFLSATGYIGLGDTSPDGYWEISDNGAGVKPFLISSNDNTDGDWMTVSSVGFVGIGTTSPWAKLSVAGNSLGTMPVFTISTSTASATSTAFIVDNNGKVGIGTTSPYAQLAVAGLTAASRFNADDAAATSTFAGGVILAKDAGNVLIGTSSPLVGSSMPLTIAQKADSQALRIYGYDDKAAAYMDLFVTSGGSPEIDAYSQTGTTKLIFGTGAMILDGMHLGIGNSNDFSWYRDSSTDKLYLYADNGANPRMVMDTNGLFGIGTTSPYAKLSVVGEVVASHFTATTTATSTFPNLYISNQLRLGSDYLTDLTGTGLTISGSALSVTGATLSGAANMLAGFDASGNLTATSAPTAAYYIATSTTATSTFAGGMIIGNGGGTNGLTLTGNLKFGADNAYDIGITGARPNDITAGGTITGSYLNASVNAAVGASGNFIFSTRSRLASAGDGMISLTNSALTDFKRLQFGGTTSLAPAIGKSQISSTTLNIELADGSFGARLGIGSTSPWGMLGIAGTSTSIYPMFVISTSTADATSTAFIVDSNGKVGIGTTSPSGSNSLAVKGNSYFTGNVGIGITGSSYPLEVNGTAASTYFYPTSGIYPGSYGLTRLGLTIGYGTSDGIISSGGANANLRLSPSGSGNTLIANGNLGLGTSTPYWPMQIASTSQSTTMKGQLVLTDSGAGTDLKHWLFSSMGGSLYIGTSSDAYATSTPSALTILNSGQVGLGTTTPTNQLGVQGSILASKFDAYDASATSTFAGGVILAKDAGNVLIGTSSPLVGSSMPLTIAQKADSQALRIYGYDDKAAAYMDLFVTSGGSPEIDAYSQTGTTKLIFGTGAMILDGMHLGIGNSNDFSWYRDSSTDKLYLYADNGANPRMVMDTNGLFGIGTTSPYAKLSVVGQTVSEYFTATSTSATSTFPYLTATRGAFTGLANCDTIDTDANGYLKCGSDNALSSGGNGTVSTSTSPTIGQLAYWTSKDAWPETLGSTATTTLTVGGSLTLTQPINVLGSSASTIELNMANANTWTGLQQFNNASTTLLTVDVIFDSNGNPGGSGEVLSSTVTGTDWIAAAGGGTVTSVATTWPIIGGPITITGTLTFGGLSTSSPISSASGLLYATGVNTLASVATSTPFTWTGLHTFSNASTTDLTVDNKVITGYNSIGFDIGTTSAWTGTSTLHDMGTAILPEVWVGAYCHTYAGTLMAYFGDGAASTTIMASSTNSYVDFADKTIAAGSKRFYQCGTPATSPTYCNCTIKKYILSD